VQRPDRRVGVSPVPGVVDVTGLLRSASVEVDSIHGGVYERLNEAALKFTELQESPSGSWALSCPLFGGRVTRVNGPDRSWSNHIR